MGSQGLMALEGTLPHPSLSSALSVLFFLGLLDLSSFLRMPHAQTKGKFCLAQRTWLRVFKYHLIKSFERSRVGDKNVNAQNRKGLKMVVFWSTDSLL